MTDTYLTVQSAAQYEQKEKGSKFIGQIFPITSSQDAGAQLDTVRKTYHDATHHCFAFRLGIGEATEERYDDDGEPAGTAGKPIQQAITGENLTNVLVVVTRYFGGTKLGTGGLARAYIKTAERAIGAATIIRKVIHARLEFQVPYDDISQVMRTIEEFNARMLNQEFDQKVSYAVNIRLSQKENFTQRLIELTSDRVDFI